MKHPSHLPHLRATAPAAIEDISVDAWQEFQALRARHEHQYLPTRPATAPMALRRDHSAAHDLARPALASDDVMVIARRNNRASPLPDPWKRLHDVLLATATAQEEPPPAPIDGPAWVAAPAMQKRLRLKQQLEWAEKHGCLAAARDVLVELPEEAWLHL